MASRKAASRSDKEDLHAAVAELSAQIQEMAENGQENLKSKLQAGAERLRDMVGTARDRGEHAAEELRDQVKDHPLMSVGIAFGVGFLLGGILKRRG